MSFGLDRIWRNRLTHSLELPKGAHILDGCTGTADQAILLASSFPESHVTGIDVSQDMLTIGREKVRKKGLLQRVSLITGNMHHLPFPSRQFDAVTVSFGLRNLADPEAALKELCRTAKPGCSLRILEFAPEPSGFGKTLKQAYIHRVVPFLGRLISGSEQAYTYLSESIAAFLTPRKVMELLERTGWDDISYKNLFPGITFLYSAVKPWGDG